MKFKSKKELVEHLTTDTPARKILNHELKSDYLYLHIEELSSSGNSEGAFKCMMMLWENKGEWDYREALGDEYSDEDVETLAKQMGLVF